MKTTPPHPARCASLRSLLWIMLFDHTSLNIIFPVLTLLFFDSRSSFFAIDVTEATRGHWYGLCIAIPHAVNLFCAPMLGVLSDCFGRKNILLAAAFGAALFALTAAISVLYGSLILLFLACLIRGIFSRTNPIAQAVIGDLLSNSVDMNNRKMIYMGYLQTAISLGAFIGPVLGGHLAGEFAFARFNFSLPFFVAALLAVIAFVLTLFFFHETLSERHSFLQFRLSRLKAIKVFIQKPKILNISLILLLSQVSWSLYYQFMPPVLKTLLNADAHEIGYFVGLIAFWLTISTLIGIKILDKFFDAQGILNFSLWLVFVGTLCNVIFFLCLPVGAWQLLLWIAAVPIAAGDVIAFSCLCTMYSDAVAKHEQGRIMGVCFVVIAAVWTITAIIGGQLLAIYTLLPLLVAPIGAWLAIVFAKRITSA